MQKHEETEMHALIHAISDEEDTEFLLNLARKIAARQERRRPVLRLAVGGAIPAINADLRSAAGRL
jgi:hypothetical protein